MPKLGALMNTRTKETTAKCPYCNGDVPAKELTIGTSVHIIPEPCSCPEAVAEREAVERAEAEREAKEKRARLVRRYEISNIPRKFYDAPLRNEAAMQDVRDGHGLYIQGENGRGKTELAAAIGCRAIQAGARVYFTSTVELKGALFSTGYKTETEEQLFARLSRAWLLILDDFGKECDSKPVVSMLYRVIDERDKSMRPVIVTSNFTKQQLTARLAQCGDESLARAIVSRLFGMTKKVEVGGRDWRIPAKDGRD